MSNFIFTNVSEKMSPQSVLPQYNEQIHQNSIANKGKKRTTQSHLMPCSLKPMLIDDPRPSSKRRFTRSQLIHNSMYSNVQKLIDIDLPLDRPDADTPQERAHSFKSMQNNDPRPSCKKRFTRSQLLPDSMHSDVQRLIDIDLPPVRSNADTDSSVSSTKSGVFGFSWLLLLAENTFLQSHDNLYTEDYAGMMYDLPAVDIDDLQTRSSPDSQALSAPVGNHSKPVVYFGPAEGLPEGWTMKQLMRISGKAEGKVDTYWFTPVLKKQLRSRVQVSRFIERMQLEDSDVDEEAVYRELLK